MELVVLVGRGPVNLALSLVLARYRLGLLAVGLSRWRSWSLRRLGLRGVSAPLTDRVGHLLIMLTVVLFVPFTLYWNLVYPDL